jgi:hypothetical protein
MSALKKTSKELNPSLPLPPQLPRRRRRRKWVVKVQSEREIKHPTTWERTKLWFFNSETIFLARAELFIGFVVTAFSIIDYASLLSYSIAGNFSWKSGILLGSILIFKGIITEWARRINTVQIDGHLVSADVVKPKRRRYV